MSTKGYSYITIAAGDSEVCREAAAPLADALDGVVPRHDRPLPSSLALGGEAQNDLVSAGILVVGVIVFVAKDFTKLVLTDVYTQLVKPRLQSVLEKIDLRLSRANRQKKKTFACSVWYDEYGVLVSVAVVGDSFDEVVKQLELIPTVHSNALHWIAANGAQKPVHHYRIEHGQVNAAPQLLDRLGDALK